MKKDLNYRVIPLDDNDRKNCVGLIKSIKDWNCFIEPEEDFANKGDFSIGKNISEGFFEYWKPQYLHVISEEEAIEPNDWCLFFDSFGHIFCDQPMQYKPEDGHVLNDGLKKIVYSSDKNLNLKPVPDIILDNFLKGRKDSISVNITFN